MLIASLLQDMSTLVCRDLLGDGHWSRSLCSSFVSALWQEAVLRHLQ